MTADGCLSVEIRAAQIEPALRTLQLAAALAQLSRTVGTELTCVKRPWVNRSWVSRPSIKLTLFRRLCFRSRLVFVGGRRTRLLFQVQKKISVEWPTTKHTLPRTNIRRRY